MAAAVILEPAAANEIVFLKRGEELRDGRGGDGGAAGELGPDDLTVGDRLQGQVLGDGEWWLVGCEQALDPATRKGRRADERIRGLAAACVITRPRQEIK